MSPNMAQGEWPNNDLVLVKDYANPSQREPRCFFRIHMDIPVAEAEWDSLDKLLKARNFQGLYAKLIAGVAHPKPGEVADKVLKAALGLP